MEGRVMTAKVLYEKRGEVAYITLNRPEGVGIAADR
jgi:enoyl-CoA hydratase/carnithine racemase